MGLAVKPTLLLVLLVAADWASCDLGGDLTLELVQVVFRHGERSPHESEVKLMPARNLTLEQRYGFAQLTNEGKRQEYEIGRVLRERYNEFLGEEYRLDSALAISSNTDRTKASLELVLAALFPPSKDLVWDEDLKWHPIPIQSVPWELDNFFNLKSCPKFEKLYSEFLETKELKDKLAPHSGIMKLLQDEFPKFKMDLENIFLLNNLITGQKVFNMPFFHWYTKEIGEEIKILAKFFLDTLSYHPGLAKLNGGSMVKKMLANMENPKRKIYLYSGHEFTVHAVTAAHNFSLDESPPFGSAIILEKLRDSKNNAYVRMLLWTGPSKKLLQINFSEYGEFCSMKDYKKLVKPMIPDESDMRCLYENVNQADLEKYFNLENRS